MALQYFLWSLYRPLAGAKLSGKSGRSAIARIYTHLFYIFACTVSEARNYFQMSNNIKQFLLQHQVSPGASSSGMVAASLWTLGRRNREGLVNHRAAITSLNMKVSDISEKKSHLSLVEECRGSSLIGRKDHSVATPALLCHKEPPWASLGALERKNLLPYAGYGIRVPIIGPYPWSFS